MKPIARAAKLAGSQAHLAAKLGCTRALIGHWIVGKHIIPPRRAEQVEAVTGVTVEELRPDLIWRRDRDGSIVGYYVPLGQAQALD